MELHVLSQRLRAGTALVVFIVASTGLTSCDGGSSDGEGNLFGVAPPVASARSAAAVPSDPSIDQNDSYVVAQMRSVSNVTVVSDEPIFDPLLGRAVTELTLEPVERSTRVEAGYTSAGQPAISEYELDAPGNPTTALVDEARITRGVGSTHAIYDAQGQLLPVETIPEMGQLESPMASVAAALAAGGEVTDGVVVSEENLIGTSAAFRAAPGYNPGGTFGVTEQLPDRRVRAMMTLDPVGGAGARPAGGGGNRMSITRTFRPHKGDAGENLYVLTEAVIEAEDSQNGSIFKSVERIQFVDLKWKHNKQKDKERKDKKSGANRLSDPYLDMPWTAPPSNLAPAPCDPEFNECGGSPSGPGGGTGTPSPTTNSCSGADVQNVVFQHGINSGGGVWGTATDRSTTRGDLEGRYCLGSVLAPSQPFGGVIPGHLEQANNLKSLVRNTGKRGFVFVSHSQGGLVSRHAAQQLVAEGSGNLVEGVLTIGTPHRGAYFAQLTKKTLFDNVIDPGASPAICGQRSTSIACRVFAPIVAEAATNYVLGRIFPTAQDNQPNSPLITKLNTTSEASFLRFGVQHYPDERWMVERLLGDNFGGHGAAWARTTEYAYKGLRIASVALFFWHTGASFCRTAANILDTIDRFWDRVTSPGMTGDGIVQGPSQIYPNATRQYTYTGKQASSHVGEVQNPYTRVAIDDAMNSYLGVRKKL